MLTYPYSTRSSRSISIVPRQSGLNLNRRLAKHVAFGEICRQLAYKADWHGRTFVQVDTWYPSSKTCSCCGHKLEELPLAVRVWTCPKCGARHDRDVNAAKNILAEGLRMLNGTAGHAGTAPEGANASGVGVRPSAA